MMRHRSADAHAGPGAHAVRLPSLRLDGILRLPPQPRSVIAFAHGSGSGRHSPRNNAVAEALGQAGHATLLFDLLHEDEAADRRNVFDVDLLATRLDIAVHWLMQQPGTARLPVGLFGASTGAAAALVAAADLRDSIFAVVSRGGRPDLAGDALPRVQAPTLLIVGGRDTRVVWLNRQVLAHMHCIRALEIVPGAGHLFEEPGTLDQVTVLARRWFDTHLPPLSAADVTTESA